MGSTRRGNSPRVSPATGYPFPPIARQLVAGGAVGVLHHRHRLPARSPRRRTKRNLLSLGSPRSSLRGSRDGGGRLGPRPARGPPAQHARPARRLDEPDRADRHRPHGCAPVRQSQDSWLGTVERPIRACAVWLGSALVHRGRERLRRPPARSAAAEMVSRRADHGLARRLALDARQGPDALVAQRA